MAIREKEREIGATLYHPKSGSKRKEESVCMNYTIQRNIEREKKSKPQYMEEYYIDTL